MEGPIQSSTKPKKSNQIWRNLTFWRVIFLSSSGRISLDRPRVGTRDGKDKPEPKRFKQIPPFLITLCKMKTVFHR